MRGRRSFRRGRSSRRRSSRRRSFKRRSGSRPIRVGYRM